MKPWEPNPLDVAARERGLQERAAREALDLDATDGDLVIEPLDDRVRFGGKAAA